MIYQKIPVDISKLKSFFPEFEELYSSFNINDDAPLIYNADTTLDIDEADEEAFETRYILLMEKYNIPELNHSDIFYISQRVIQILDRISDYTEFDLHTKYALDFFIKYQNLVEELDKKKKDSKDNVEETKQDPIIIQIKNKHQIEAVSLLNEGSGRYFAKVIFESFKKSRLLNSLNITLSQLFKDYEEIPPSEILESFKISDVNYQKVAQDLLGEMAIVLSYYLETYLPKSVYSKKKGLITFELFYLFDTLKYAGKVKSCDSKELVRENLNTDYILPLNKSKVAPFIKELINNHNKRQLYSIG